MTLHPLMFAIFGLSLDTIFSTQGIMVLLLMAYGGAMWMFLSSAPKVYTIMVSDLEIARQFYEGDLELAMADVPLQYYYNYEQTLGATTIDPLYMAPSTFARVANPAPVPDGLWYQLKKNVQLHVIAGASLGDRNHQRHVCFDRDCLEQILLRIQVRGIRHKIRQELPLNFLVKDWSGRTLELTEAGQ
ncbi:glyoxalase-like domain protein [Limnothrix redekei]|uniref:Glyoxalase-like domain protein n=1 Tax=Limnothrix redekei LRLZ20PSL1 TaxID=3112953 RepID=A0ABW7CD37_9CYAN